MNGKNFTVGDNVKLFTIAEAARDNPDFAKVLRTGENAPIVAMTIPPGDHRNPPTKELARTYISQVRAISMSRHDVGLTGFEPATP